MDPSIYTYIISSHGEIITTFDPRAIDEEFLFFPIHMPDNIEILTYTSLGESYWEECTTINFQCNKSKNILLGVKTPIHKYKKRFPELTLAPESPNDEIPQLRFYSGIVHCIPESREDSSKKKEIIHNMDANSLKDCSDDSIFPYYSRSKTPSVKRPYYSTNKYSKDYVEVLKTPGIKRKSPLHLINKCGPLFLSQAIAIIIYHCKTTYPTNYSKSIIQIHITSCLVLSENPIDYNPGMKTVNNFSYFTSESTNIDPKIKDTPHIKTYSFIFEKKVFVIEVPKPESYNYGVTDKEAYKYEEALSNALKIIDIKGIDLLPDEITIFIPEGRTMKEEDTRNYILNILNKLISDSAKLSKKSNRKRSNSPQSRKKAIKLDKKEIILANQEEGDQAEKELYELMLETPRGTIDKEKKLKRSRKTHERSSPNEPMHSVKKHRETSKGGKKRVIRRYRLAQNYRKTRKTRKRM